MPEPIIRRAKPDDAEACHRVMWASVTDFGARNGTPLSGTAEEWWTGAEVFARFLATHAAEWWVAEDAESGKIIGFSRSIERGGLLELTEFFVLPENQARGVGRALIERAFPADRGDIRSIIATTDVRALRRYYAAGTAARFPLLTLTGEPVTTGGDANLAARGIDATSDADLAAVDAIETGLLGYGRGADELRWLLEDRDGYLYLDHGRPVGYGFMGKLGSGPIGAVDPAHLPAILLHLEGRAAAMGVERVEFQVPAPNEAATRHLLGRGFRLDPWVNLLMSDRPFGRFDRVISFGPPVFL
jgi:GNAT superfamily N-acetyltransferase